MRFEKLVLPFVVTLLVALAAFGSMASAEMSDQKKANTSWDFDRAPTNRQVSAYTSFLYNDSAGGDDWQSLIMINAEVAMPFYESFSVFAQWGVRIIDDFGDAEGLDDFEFGLKWAFIDDDAIVVSMALDAIFPIDGDSYLDDAWVGSAWLMASFFALQEDSVAFGVNLTTKYGLLFDGRDLAGNPEDIFIFNGAAELFLNVWEVSVKTGLEVAYTFGDYDDASWAAYLEGQFMFLFARVAFPIDTNNPFGRLEDGLFEGVFALIVGVSIGLP